MNENLLISFIIGGIITIVIAILLIRSFLKDAKEIERKNLTKIWMKLDVYTRGDLWEFLKRRVK